MTASAAIGGARWSLFFFALLLFMIFEHFSHTNSFATCLRVTHFSFQFFFFIIQPKITFLFTFQVFRRGWHKHSLTNPHTRTPNEKSASNSNLDWITRIHDWNKMEHFDVFLLSFVWSVRRFRGVPVLRRRARKFAERECKRRTAMCNSLHSSHKKNVRSSRKIHTASVVVISTALDYLLESSLNSFVLSLKRNSFL